MSTTLSPTEREARARVAALSRHRGPDDPELSDARRDFRAARLEDYVRAAVEAAPPLTDEQRRKLAVLLHPREVGHA